MQQILVAGLRGLTGTDMNSPRYQAAAKACGVSLPGDGG
jgi:hypothetical protein